MNHILNQLSLITAQPSVSDRSEGNPQATDISAVDTKILQYIKALSPFEFNKLYSEHKDVLESKKSARIVPASKHPYRSLFQLLDIPLIRNMCLKHQGVFDEHLKALANTNTPITSSEQLTLKNKLENIAIFLEKLGFLEIKESSWLGLLSREHKETLIQIAEAHSLVTLGAYLICGVLEESKNHGAIDRVVTQAFVAKIMQSQVDIRGAFLNFYIIKLAHFEDNRSDEKLVRWVEQIFTLANLNEIIFNARTIIFKKVVSVLNEGGYNNYLLKRKFVDYILEACLPHGRTRDFDIILERSISIASDHFTMIIECPIWKEFFVKIFPEIIRHYSSRDEALRPTAQAILNLVSLGGLESQLQHLNYYARKRLCKHAIHTRNIVCINAFFLNFKEMKEVLKSALLTIDKDISPFAYGLCFGSFKNQLSAEVRTFANSIEFSNLLNDSKTQLCELAIDNLDQELLAICFDFFPEMKAVLHHKLRLPGDGIPPIYRLIFEHSTFTIEQPKILSANISPLSAKVFPFVITELYRLDLNAKIKLCELALDKADPLFTNVCFYLFYDIMKKVLNDRLQHVGEMVPSIYRLFFPVLPIGEIPSKSNAINKNQLSPLVTNYFIGVLNYLEDATKTKLCELAVVQVDAVFVNVFFDCFEQMKGVLQQKLLVERGIDPVYPLCFGPFNHFLDHYKSLVARGYPISPSILNYVIPTYNYAFFDYILNSVSNDWFEQYADSILESLSMYKNPRAINDLLKRCPGFFKSKPLNKAYLLGVFKRAVNQREGWFIQLLLNQGIELSLEEMEELLPQIIRSYNLTTIRSFCQYAERKKMTSKVLQYPTAILEDFTITSDMPLSINPHEHVKQVLFSYVLHSDLIEIYRLVQFMPENISDQMLLCLDEVIKTIALCTRFPDNIAAANIKYLDNTKVDLDGYNKSTLQYCQKNREFLKQISPTFPKFNRNEILEKIIDERFKYNPDLTAPYRQWIKYLNTDVYLKSAVTNLNFTPLIQVENHLLAKRVRYEPSLMYLSDCLYDVSSGRWRSIKDVSIENHEVYFYYSDESIRSHPIHVSTVSVYSGGVRNKAEIVNGYLFWKHNPVNAGGESPIHILEPHLEKLHEEILKLSKLNCRNKEAIMEVLGELIWLGSVLCETSRGTPHNQMMLLNIYLEYLNLPPLVPRREHYFYDNRCLNTPSYLMANKFTEEERTDCFEPLFDEALIFDAKDEEDNESQRIEFLSKCFEKNGMLLGLCSERVRSNQKLVDVAVKQNKDAQIFACYSSISQHNTYRADFYEHK